LAVTTATAPTIADNSTRVPTTAFLQQFIAVQGTFKNLKGIWISNTTATFTADQIFLQNSSNQPSLATSYSQTLNTATSGAGGLDTGSTAASTWYYVWAIQQTGAVSLNILMSLSSTAPTMPSGYTYMARIGSLYLDASKNIRGFLQFGRNTRWIVGDNLSTLPIMASGTAGNPTVPTYVSVATGAYVPPTASQIILVVNNANNGVTLVAPNNNYGTDASNIPPYSAANSGGNSVAVAFSMAIESSNIYWSNNAGTSSQIASYGYEDNL
jgi:hypothetical protein